VQLNTWTKKESIQPTGYGVSIHQRHHKQRVKGQRKDTEKKEKKFFFFLNKVMAYSKSAT
jgi:hypothetical protein